MALGRPRDSLVGNRYGTLTVVEFAYVQKGHTCWKVRCDCGAEKVSMGHNLKSGNVRNCGCVGNRRFTEGTLNQAYSTHKSLGRRTGRGFLEKEFWLKVVQSPCHYCGQTEVRNSAKSRSRESHRRVGSEEFSKWDVQMVGIDRKDASRGYLQENVVPCCQRCNRMKLDSSYEQFREEIKRIYEFWVKRAD